MKKLLFLFLLTLSGCCTHEPSQPVASQPSVIFVDPPVLIWSYHYLQLPPNQKVEVNRQVHAH